MSRFSASNAARLMACPGSADLYLSIPNWVPPDPTPGAAAQRGTNLHAVLEEANNLGIGDLRDVVKILNYIYDLRNGRKFNVLAEYKMEAKWLEPDPVTSDWPETTADLVLYIQDEMHILDPKFGKIKVEAIENYQLLYYAATYGFLAPKAKGIHLHILQPGIDSMESWFADTDRIALFMAEARAAQQRVLNKDTTLSPGDHCTFCPANPHSRRAKGHPLCPAMMQMLYPLVDVDEDAIFNL